MISAKKANTVMKEVKLMKAKEVVEWVVLGLGGAAMAILGQIMTNHSVKRDVEETVKKEKES